MRSPIPDYLADVLAAVSPDTSGAPADYIPELAAVDPDRLGVAIATVDGAVYEAGDSQVEFTIQSISKPFAYGFALNDLGFDAVLAKIGVEPSGEAFNELSLERGSMRPLNPMINAGAITAHSLTGADEGARGDRVLRGLSSLAGRQLAVDKDVYHSEIDHANRNLALAHMLKSYGILQGDVEAIVRGYIWQCSILVTARDLALMAATLVNGGVQPVTGQRVYPPDVVRQVLSVMLNAGMYNAAGDWMTTVGIPAKSGVGGGLIGGLPGQLGIATFSPRLDSHGNSVRGIRAFEMMSSDMGLHLMDAGQPARSVMRQVDEASCADGVPATRYELQGTFTFAGAERVLREVVEHPPTKEAVVFDFGRVYSVTDVARRMMLEGRRRLEADGVRVDVLDPDGVLAS